MPTKREGEHVIAARLSRESYDALMDYVAQMGTNVSALLEGIGRVLAAARTADGGFRWEDLPDQPDWLESIMEDSRRIAAERRRRRS